MNYDETPEPPNHLLRAFLVLVLGLVSTLYFYQKDVVRYFEGHDTGVMMSFAPIATGIHPKQAPAEPVTKEVKIERNQTFSDVMQSQGFDPSTVNEIWSGVRNVYDLGRIHEGQSLRVCTAANDDFAGLQYSIDPLQTLVVTKNGESISAEIQKKTLEVSVHELGGNIEGSLYNTIDRLGESDELVVRFAEIFEWDVDFFKDLQAGDEFRILYEKQTVDGEAYGYGRVLGAELVNKGRVLTAIGYQQGSNWEFFSPDGKAMKKAFLAAPLKFTRISSGFTSHRYHPVLHSYRAHYGIDYAAPAGTPVRAIGNGKVISAGYNGGAGNMIKLEHDQNITTAYCHLSRFAAGVRAGAHVSQGQVIGYVGSTGLATGPHLDFRFLKNGKYINFLSLKVPQAEPLSSKETAEFISTTKGVFDQLRSVRLMELPQDIASVSPNSPHLNETN